MDRALMLAGPTAVGKTAIAMCLANEFPFELISADSMQVYQGMAIGTAAPTLKERQQIPYHLIEVIHPGEPFDVSKFLMRTHSIHHQIESRGKKALYVGGTGLYLRALRWGLFEESGRDPSVREALTYEAQTYGSAILHARLCQVDPVSAARIGVHDAIRIIRALEAYAVTGKPLSALQTQWTHQKPRFEHYFIVLSPPREHLRKKIAQRVDCMLQSGWIQEVQTLLNEGIPESAHCFKALGYRVIIDYLDGVLNYDAMRQKIIDQTRQFSRRQMIWLRRERDAIWMDVNPDDPHEAAQRISKILRGEASLPTTLFFANGNSS